MLQGQLPAEQPEHQLQQPIVWEINDASGLPAILPQGAGPVSGDSNEAEKKQEASENSSQETEAASQSGGGQPERVRRGRESARCLPAPPAQVR